MSKEEPQILQQIRLTGQSLQATRVNLIKASRQMIPLRTLWIIQINKIVSLNPNSCFHKVTTDSPVVIEKQRNAGNREQTCYYCQNNNSVILVQQSSGKFSEIHLSFCVLREQSHYKLTKIEMFFLGDLFMRFWRSKIRILVETWPAKQMLFL